MLTDHPIPGFVWSRGWQAPFEGPYTLTAKLLQATVVGRSSLRAHMFVDGPTGMSLVELRPRKDRDGSMSPAAKLLCDASLHHQFSPVAWLLADDAALRYCYRCMQHGYQAAIAQIAGLERCPIHNTRYRTTCLGCGAPAPLYRVYKHATGPKFTCAKCAECFAPSSGVDSHIGRWKAPDGVERIQPVVDWLKGFTESSGLSWRNSGTWSSTSQIFSEGSSALRQTAALRILQTLRPGPMPLADANVAVWGPFPFGSADDVRLAFVEHLKEVLREILACVDLVQSKTTYVSGRSVTSLVPVDLRVPPQVHAAALLCKQFGMDHTSLFDGSPVEHWHWFDRRLESLASYSSTPESIGWMRELVKGYVAAMWHAALRIAQQWHQKVRELKVRGRELVKLFDCLPYMSGPHFCSWATRGYEPVAMISTSKWFIHGPKQVYFAIG